MATFYKANNEYNASTTAGYTVGDGTLNVNTIPSNTPTIVTVARDTVYETRFTVTGASSGQLTGIVRLDGANVDIPAGVSVECMVDEDFINQLEAAVFDQTSLKGLVYAADGGASDAYAISLPVAPDAYADILGLPISFKANTVNTGAATLNVNTLGAKTIKKFGTQDLDDGDIKADQIVTVIYDGTDFQLQSLSLGDVLKPTIVELPVGNSVLNLATGDGQAFFRVPDTMNGMNLTGVAAAVYTAGTTGTLDVQIRNKTQTADMLTTKITIDSGETDTSTATPAVIDTGNDDVATGDVIAIDIDAVHTTPAKGLVIQMKFELP